MAQEKDVAGYPAKPARPSQLPRYLAVAAVLIVLALAVAGTRGRRSGSSVTGAPPGKNNAASDPEVTIPVVAATVEPSTLTETMRLTGNLKTDENVTLATKLAGRVAMLRVREGDHVRAGQLVVQMDDSENRAQQDRAIGAVRAAQAKLAQTKAGTVVKDTGAQEDYAKAKAAVAAARQKVAQDVRMAAMQDTMAETRVRTAQAGLQSAQAHLKELQTGSRRQELLIARQAVDRAQIDLENARLNYTRRQELVKQGAISQQDADDARHQYELAQVQLADAREQASLTQEGPRTEEIQMAQQQVTQAEQALQEAEANRAQSAVSHDEVAAAKDELRQAQAVERSARAGLVQSRLSQEDVRSAAATVQQLQGDVAYYGELMRQARIVSPISGTVVQKMVNQGEYVSLGAKLLNIVSRDSLFLEAIASERQLPRLRPGQVGTVTIDARPGQVYTGVVRDILPVAEGLSRSTRVRIFLRSGPSGRPVDTLPIGAFARVALPVTRHADVLAVPADAVLSEAGVNYVFAVVGGRAQRRNIELGLREGDRIQVTSGLRAGDRVVTAGSPAVVDGARVTVK